MPSPPPRKVKPAVWLREIHAKQLGSLQGREQQLLDIIEDIRLYSKQRSDIERIYGQSLLKLSSQLLAKKDLFIVEENNPSDENRTIQSAWKCCLEEVGKTGTIRVKAAEIYTQNVSERCRVLKGHKSAAIKRALDQLTSLQTDLTQAVKEFGTTHKQYTDDEIQAYEARAKANNADQRLNNKDTGLFSSVNTLKKGQAKSFAKMEQCNSQSISSRNGYLLELSAVNAHTSKLHTKHMPTLFKALDDGVYDQLSSCICTLAQTEIDSCNGILSTHSRVVSDCEKVTPQYNLDCFLQANPVFSEQLTFHFEAVQNDPIDYLSTEYGEHQRLEKETRNWARKVARETRSLADLHDKINQLTNKAVSIQGSAADSALEVELVRMQASIRRSEIAKLKAEARLELLRTANMPVDEILTQATTEHESMSVADTQSLTSRDSSHHSADTFDSSSDNLDSLNRHHYIPGTASDPANWTSSNVSNHNQADNLSTSQDSALSTVRVIYDYKACQQDELTLAEDELLSILDHGSGDGWLRACNSDGVVGMVPENYIESYEDTASINENSSMSADLSMDNTAVQQEPPQPLPPQHYEPPQPQYEPQPAHPPHPPQPPTGIGYVRALYDYSADGEDEISFAAGQVITLISRDENDIDDGYWKGEVAGIQGMFPSLVVEDVDDAPHVPPQLAVAPHQFNTWNATAQSPPHQQPSTDHHQQPYTDQHHQPSTDQHHQPSTDQQHQPQQHQPQQHQPQQHLPPPSPPPAEDIVAPESSNQTFAGSYSQHTSTQSAASSSLSHHNHQFKSAHLPLLPVIPDEDESVNEQLSDSDQSAQTMSLASELYPSNPSPRVARRREIRQSVATPPVINRNSKPVIQTSHAQSYPGNDTSVNGTQRAVKPSNPPKPTVNYTRKPTIADPPPHPTGVLQHSPPPPSANTTVEKPIGRRFQHPVPLPSAVTAGVEPVARANHNQYQSLTRPDSYSWGDNDRLTKKQDSPDYTRQSNSMYEEIDHMNEGNIRGRYQEVRNSRPHGLAVEPLYSDPSMRGNEDVETRRFRQMQPVPHQYYMEHAGSRTGDMPRDRALSGRGSDPNLLRDRSSSNRSFASLSSSDSLDDKQTPIKIPGRRHLSSDSPSDPPTPVAPLSLREASRLMPQGLVNPSYRVATMSVDMMPSSGSHHTRGSPHNARPTATRREGGLPGHVRHGIVQGRKMLNDAANDSPAAAANAQSMKRQPPKSETAV